MLRRRTTVARRRRTRIRFCFSNGHGPQENAFYADKFAVGDITKRKTDAPGPALICFATINFVD
jgi:hypothetical protein